MRVQSTGDLDATGSTSLGKNLVVAGFPLTQCFVKAYEQFRHTKYRINVG
jgi:hypothetical protein